MIRTSLQAAVAALMIPALSAQSAPAGLPDVGFRLHPLLAPMSSFADLRFDELGGLAAADPIAYDDFTYLSPLHQEMVLRMFREVRETPAPHGCWLTMPSPQVATLFLAAMKGQNGFVANPNDRWSFTATNGGGLLRGDPTTIRYSFVPDGTFIPGSFGVPGAGSNMFQQLNSAFGSQTAWQNVIHSAFDRWGELTGCTYIYEPNDDGATHGAASGQINVRGDVRIGMKFIDGSSNILAYNAYPNNGDMVLDSGDTSFFSNPSQNYRRLYNTIAHEHGHGLGIDHVCPLITTKLMEPSYTSTFSGPQFDDILAGQRLYGDANEPNDGFNTATDLGTLPDGTTNQTNQSIDGTTDNDYFRFNVLSSKLVSISVVPVGSTYASGVQLSNGQCSSGSNYNPAQQRNLAVYLFNSNGSSLLASAFSAPIGQTESTQTVQINGTYVVRVLASGSDLIQPYRLEINIVDNGPIATATSVGQGCGLTWNAINTPRIGTTMVHTMTGITNPPGSIGLVLIGSTPIPGGLSLASIGAPGCQVYQQLDTVLPVFPLSTPILVHTLPIPNNPLLAGTTVRTQGALLTPGVNAFGGLTANATDLFLGTQ
ncbi:MAG: matrixin family metalloprotease [Planctomycetota bacterium]|nr:matrixin family metalloprotease [Planctomycetota bacterium]